MRAEITEIEKNQGLKTPKASFLKRLIKIDKPLARLTKKKEDIN